MLLCGLFAVLAQEADADPVPAERGAQRLWVYAKRSRNLAGAERRQNGDDFSEFSCCPAAAAFGRGSGQQGQAGRGVAMRRGRVLQHGCLVNAELVDGLWKITISGEFHSSTTKLHVTGKQSPQFYLNLRKRIDGLNPAGLCPYLGKNLCEDATGFGIEWQSGGRFWKGRIAQTAFTKRLGNPIAFPQNRSAAFLPAIFS
jgi:hypothetical protein